jgi:hypothetical protein
MTYVVVGSGPTGLSLAYILALNDTPITLIEQDQQLGGSWNSQWINDKYFSENSPRVLSLNGNTKKLLVSIGLTKHDFKNIYGNFFKTNWKFIVFLHEHFNILDYFVFLFAAVKYRFVTKNIVLSKWIKCSGLSIQGQKAIKILSILICDKPENTNLNDFFCSLSLSIPKQMIEPNKWHEMIESYLQQKNNIRILKNTKVTKLESTSCENLIDSVHIKNIVNNQYSIIKANKVILCTQSNNIYPIIKDCSSYVQNNWMPINKMKEWSNNTFYSGFGFQLHFDKYIKFKNNWCWSCGKDWTVIILPVSNWLTQYSKDQQIKTVWSCCIVDMETKSQRLNKTPNECTIHEIIDECMYQIKSSYNIPGPNKITISKGIARKDNKWISKNTGFTRNIYDKLMMKGKIDNLYALGCFTQTNQSHISYIGNAIDATALYLKNYENLNKKVFF